MANVSNIGDKKESREDNFWKRKEFIANEVDSFKQSNPTLFGAPVDLPEFESQQPSQPEPTSQTSTDGSFNFSSSYEESEPRTITDIVLQKSSPGEKPKYDEKQKARLQKQAKYAAIAQGIQGLAGAIGLAGGYDVPKIDQSQIGSDAINRLGELDEKYFKEMAQYRDAELKSNFYNTQSENDASMAEWRARQDRLTREGKMEFESGEAQKNRDFKAGEAQKDKDFKAREAQKGRNIRNKELANELKRYENYSNDQMGEVIKRYEAEHDDLYQEYTDAISNFDDTRATELLPQIQENIRIRRDLQKQLLQREGGQFPELQANVNDSDLPPSNLGDALRQQGTPSQNKKQPVKTQPSQQEGKNSEVKQSYNSMVHDAVTNGTISSEQLNILLENPTVDKERTIKILESKGVKIPDDYYQNNVNPYENSYRTPKRDTRVSW